MSRFTVKLSSLVHTSLSAALSVVAKHENSNLLTQLAVYEDNREVNWTDKQIHEEIEDGSVACWSNKSQMLSWLSILFPYYLLHHLELTPRIYRNLTFHQCGVSCSSPARRHPSQIMIIWFWSWGHIWWRLCYLQQTLPISNVSKWQIGAF